MKQYAEMYRESGRPTGRIIDDTQYEKEVFRGGEKNEILAESWRELDEGNNDPFYVDSEGLLQFA